MAFRSYVAARKLGHVFDGQTGFRLPDGNLRSPDVSFVTADRLAGGIPAGFLHVAPDLAVEVLSPTDRAADVAHKVGEFSPVPFASSSDSRAPEPLRGA